jgi:hypothetical protein
LDADMTLVPGDDIETVTEGDNLTAAEVARYEDVLQGNPGDLRARLLLLGFYALRSPRSGEHHIVWLAENRPGTDAIPAMMLPASSPAYEATKDIFLRHASEPEVALEVVTNAALFLRDHEPDFGERLLASHSQRFGGRADYWGFRASYLVAWLRRLGPGPQRKGLLRAAMVSFDQHFNLVGVNQSRQAGTGARVAVEVEDYQLAKTIAEALLRRGLQERVEWAQSNDIHRAHTVLGLIALRNASDDTLAMEHLLASVSVRGSPHLTTGALSLELAAELLKRGNLQAVIQFLSDAERLWTEGEQVDEFREAAQALRAGVEAPFLRLATQRAPLGPNAGQPLSGDDPHQG